MRVVVLGLDDGERDLRFVIENIVGALRLAARHHLAAYDDAAVREGDLFAELRDLVRPGLTEGGSDEFGTDIPLAQLFLIHPARLWCVAYVPRGAGAISLSSGAVLSRCARCDGAARFGQLGADGGVALDAHLDER